MTKKKPSQAQIAARKKFAAMAKARAGKKKPAAKKKAAPKRKAKKVAAKPKAKRVVKAAKKSQTVLVIYALIKGKKMYFDGASKLTEKKAYAQKYRSIDGAKADAKLLAKKIPVQHGGIFAESSRAPK